MDSSEILSVPDVIRVGDVFADRDKRGYRATRHVMVTFVGETHCNVAPVGSSTFNRRDTRIRKDRLLKRFTLVATAKDHANAGA